ncbi:MAG TPA: hypothetical protein DD670_12115 [Planctomycetaceae bacterium]|nr:hypothetical protein [Planctomycetaceae bacterium]
MTKNVIQPLESYRLAQYAVPMRCYLCDAENTFDAELCTHCLAPMALAHQAADQEVQPRMIATVGASSAGKTVYLGMLMDMLSRLPARMRVVTRGAFSISLQQNTVMALSQRHFPDKTASEPDRWNWVHCQIRRPDRPNPVELIMPDMAGEAILEEIDHPHTYRVIGSFLKKSGGILALVDAISLREGRRDHDYFTMKLLSYLAELDSDPRSGWCTRPVAIVFTKADQCEACLDNPLAFARSHATGLWQQCQERFPRHRFFASGVVGAIAYSESILEGHIDVPLRVEPHGIIEPFEWLLDETADQGNKRRR